MIRFFLCVGVYVIFIGKYICVLIKYKFAYVLGYNVCRREDVRMWT